MSTENNPQVQEQQEPVLGDILAPRAKRLLVNHGFLGHTAAIFYNYDDSLPKAITDDQTFE